MACSVAWLHLRALERGAANLIHFIWTACPVLRIRSVTALQRSKAAGLHAESNEYDRLKNVSHFSYYYYTINNTLLPKPLRATQFAAS